MAVFCGATHKPVHDDTSAYREGAVGGVILGPGFQTLGPLGLRSGGFAPPARRQPIPMTKAAALALGTRGRAPPATRGMAMMRGASRLSKLAAMMRLRKLPLVMPPPMPATLKPRWLVLLRATVAHDRQKLRSLVPSRLNLRS